MMSVFRIIKNVIKAFVPYGIIALRRRIYKKRFNLGQQRMESYRISVFKKRYLKQGKNGKAYFDFNGAFLPDISGSTGKMNTLLAVFSDTFMFHCLFNDRYDKSVVEILDLYMHEGPYGYTDGTFDITVKENDVVIDAGAWIGDFSAYSASKGAFVYAFEPVAEQFSLLEETARLNTRARGKIYPVKKGLADKQGEVPIFITPGSGSANTLLSERGGKQAGKETIAITTLDRFVEENNLQKIDFIKADIEGAERDMLKGAAKVLQNLHPKLALCTYHLPDDPEVLEKLILEANPKYTIVHLRKKLFAWVV